MTLRVLTWNLMHGRAVPSAGRELMREFGAALAGWEWDVALLQEVPPWWPEPLARALGAEQRTVLTSRNEGLALRRAIAVRWPDLIRSNGGGCNAILTRADRIIADRAVRLCRLPERRWAHGALLARGIWVANLHASAGDPARAQRDVALAAAAARGWAAGGLVLGGDFNLRAVAVDGLRSVAGRDVDHVLIDARLRADGEASVLERGALSDHPPLAVTVRGV